jgi:hypothetical protein
MRSGLKEYGAGFRLHCDTVTDTDTTLDNTTPSSDKTNLIHVVITTCRHVCLPHTSAHGSYVVTIQMCMPIPNASVTENKNKLE